MDSRFNSNLFLFPMPQQSQSANLETQIMLSHLRAVFFLDVGEDLTNATPVPSFYSAAKPAKKRARPLKRLGILIMPITWIG